MNKKKQHAKVCRDLGIDPSTVPVIMDVKDALRVLKSKTKIPTFKDVEKELRDYFLADWSLVKIVEAFNLQPDGKIWRPDYRSGNNEWKWQPNWFEIKADDKNPSGFGFSLSAYVYCFTYSVCGSRLACKEENHIRFIVKQFEGLFEKKILLNKK